MENSCVQVRMLWIPLLFQVVGDNLGGAEEGDKKQEGIEERTTGGAEERRGGNTNTPPSSTVMAQMLGRKWQPPSSSYPDCLGASREYWCHQQTNGGPYISPVDHKKKKSSLSEKTRSTCIQWFFGYLGTATVTYLHIHMLLETMLIRAVRVN